MRRAVPLALAWIGAAAAAPLPPQLGEAGRADFRNYQAAPAHRAFAIAPGGAWGWQAEAARRSDAEEGALAACQKNTQQKCVPFDVDGQRVFDAKAWPQLWGPYADARAARAAAVGREVGARFPDLAYVDAAGRKLSVARLQGKVAVLHFWGSWCGPCRREMPDLQKLYESLKDRPDISFVLLQVREPFAVAQQWAAAQGLRLPFYDSGAGGESDGALRLADGMRLPDRELAMSFPTTYVVDKRGIVVFAHVGPVPDWSQYRDFLLDAARRSGR